MNGGRCRGSDAENLSRNVISKFDPHRKTLLQLHPVERLRDHRQNAVLQRLRSGTPTDTLNGTLEISTGSGLQLHGHRIAYLHVPQLPFTVRLAHPPGVSVD